MGSGGYTPDPVFITAGRSQSISSAIVADLMGHADTRMAETIYLRNTARRRDETAYECRINSWIRKTTAIDTFCDNWNSQKTSSHKEKSRVEQVLL